MTTPADPFAVLRTKKYVALLVLAAVLGVVISTGAYWYLKLITDMQFWVFTDLPKGLGFDGAPPWWPLLPLAVAGVIAGLTIRYLPGRGGHSPADGFKASGVALPAELPGIFLASLAGLSLGAVIGPEAPLIALGGGLAVLAVKLARRDVLASTGAVIAATGSFAAIATLLRSPGAAHAAGWPGHRRACDRLRRGHRETAVGCAVLRPDGTPAAGRARVELHGGSCSSS